MGWAVGRGGVGWRGVGGGKNYPLGHPMSSLDAHTVVNDTPVGVNSGPHCPIGALHGCHCSSHDLGGLAECPSEK